MRGLRLWSGRLVVVSAAPLISFSSRFGRNVILSRILVPEEFGTTLAITVVLSLGQLVTDVALDRFVMLNDSQRYLAGAHALSILRGVIVAVALVAVSPQFATMFGVANFSSSFVLAASLFSIGGFAHLGVKQMQRRHKYLPETISQIVSNVGAVIALFLSVSTLRDHRVIIVSYAAEMILYVLCSHLLARTAYRIRFERQVLREALAFGLPLTVNGIGLAVIQQFDRTLVGYWFGVAELANYAVILSVGVIPTNLVLNMFSNIGLSYILTGEDKPTSNSERYRILLGSYAVLSTFYVLWMALTLDILTPLIFTKKFGVSPALHVLFAIIACLRLQRGGGPTTLFLANGRTRVLALVNLSAGLGLLAACIMLFLWPRLESMLIGAALGEVVAFSLSLALSEEQSNSPARLVRELWTALAAPMAIIAILAVFPNPTWESRSIIFGVGLFAILLQCAHQVKINHLQGFLRRKRALES